MYFQETNDCLAIIYAYIVFRRLDETWDGVNNVGNRVESIV